ncbi:hypothetical protein GPUN_1713 [Glaciecola punicea ACAM 611]|uniref:Uncharacterized protein n=1 Tax=Glaciecola punicea ACAM 611 TaxID=1121923 RepID=H5TC02_9ALTE|nr:hypothetical protein GPUN_1713 [Glaciecola punicea ACAM 611]
MKQQSTRPGHVHGHEKTSRRSKTTKQIKTWTKAWKNVA